jgi:hypothetical protein
LIYEKRLSSLPALERELGHLDGDAGVRVAGMLDGARCFAFVTRFQRTYTVAVYSVRKGAVRAPGRRLASKEFAELADVVAFLRSIAVPRVEAYAY